MRIISFRHWTEKFGGHALFVLPKTYPLNLKTIYDT